MRINVDDIALRDPDINRRLPRFTGLSRFDAFGRLVHVWGLAYDRRSAVLLMEDVDDVAEHGGYAAAMVLAGIADQVDEASIRVHGVADRISYLVKQAELGAKGGAKRRDEGSRGAGGKFAKGSPPAADSDGVDDGQGSTKRTPSEPLAIDQGKSKPTSGSGSAPDHAPDLSLAPAREADPAGDVPARAPIAAFPPDLALVEHVVRRLNAARAEIDPAAIAIDDRGHDRDGRLLLLERLATIAPADRARDANHAVDVLIAEATLKRDPGLLRLGLLASPKGWRRLLDSTVAGINAAARGRDGPPAGHARQRHTTGQAATSKAAYPDGEQDL